MTGSFGTFVLESGARFLIFSSEQHSPGHGTIEQWNIRSSASMVTTARDLPLIAMIHYALLVTCGQEPEVSVDGKPCLYDGHTYFM